MQPHGGVASESNSDVAVRQSLTALSGGIAAKRDADIQSRTTD